MDDSVGDTAVEAVVDSAEESESGKSVVEAVLVAVSEFVSGSVEDVAGRSGGVMDADVDCVGSRQS